MNRKGRIACGVAAALVGITVATGITLSWLDVARADEPTTVQGWYDYMWSEFGTRDSRRIDLDTKQAQIFSDINAWTTHLSAVDNINGTHPNHTCANPPYNCAGRISWVSEDYEDGLFYFELGEAWLDEGESCMQASIDEVATYMDDTPQEEWDVDDIAQQISDFESCKFQCDSCFDNAEQDLDAAIDHLTDDIHVNHVHYLRCDGCEPSGLNFTS